MPIIPRLLVRLAPALAVVGTVAILGVSILRAQQPGRVDRNFNPGANAVFLPDGTPAGTPVFGGTVYTISFDAGNNVLVGGNFTSAVTAAGAGGQRNFLARYSDAGAPDTGFNTVQNGGPDGPVFTSFLFPDRIGGTPMQPVIFPGGFFLGGSFRRIQDQSQLRAGAISSTNGALLTDADNPGAGFKPSVNDEVLASVLQNGQPVIAGRFTSVGGRLVSRVERLDAATGAPDMTFNPGAGADGDVFALAVDGAGGIYVGGEFLSFDSTISSRLVHLTADGAVDRTFAVGAGFNAPVRAIQVLGNGQVLVAGDFTSYQGTPAGQIVRLNADGTRDTTFATGAGAINPIRALAVQANNGAVIIGGDFTSFNGTPRNRVARLNGTTGALDNTFDPGTGANAPVYAVAVNGNGNIYVGGQFTSFNAIPRGGFVRLTTAGALDTAFNDASGFGVGFTVQEVTAVAAASNGKILVGGNFNSITGLSASGANGLITHNFIERLNANGTVDQTFQIGRGPDNLVTALFAQPQATPPNGSDDAIILAGQFTNVDDGTVAQPISGLARLGPTGALDATFKPAVDGQVNAFAGVANGAFVVAGDFRNVNGSPRGSVARLTAAGALDPTFDPGVGFSSGVDALAVQSDGRLLAGGRFTAFNGPGGRFQPYVARLLTNGSLDSSFTAQPDGRVEALAIQADGNILIGGTFVNVAGTARNGLARLGINGRLDPAFNPVLNAGAEVLTITIQPNGRLLISGVFTSVNGAPRANVARLNADGTLDASFNPGAGTNGMVETLVRKANGTILIGGTFTSVDGQPRARLAQLQSDQPPTTLQFSADSYTVNQVEGSATITVTRQGGTAGAVGVTYATQDGSATSGINYQTVTGTLFWADGDGSPKTFRVPVFVAPNNGGATNYTVGLTLSNVTGDATLGTPQAATLNITSEAPSNVQFAATTFAARESDGATTITVTRTGGSLATTVSVNYATSDTNGGAGVRYTPVSGTLTFGPNDVMPKTFTVPIINNAVRDGDQVVQLTLGATTGFVVRGSPSVASLVIVDDETPPAGSNAQFSATSYSVREDAGSVAVVILRTDNGVGRVAVTYSTADGSANAAGRYQPTNGTVIFENGDTTPKVVRVPIINDSAVNGDATVALTLTSTAGGNPVPGGTATLTIVDDDAQPATLPTTFQFSSPTYTAFETMTTATITVTRAGGPAAPFSASGGQVSVQYFVTDGSGRLGVNYANTFASPTNGMLTWSANDFTPKTFTVALLRDGSNAGDVQVNVLLSSPRSLSNSFGNVIIPASLGTPNQATLSIVDADLPSVLQFSQGSYQTFEDRGAAVLNVVRTGGLGNAVAVAYTTGGGTAVPGLRYTPASGILSWPAGDNTPRSIVIPILQNGDLDPDQTIGVTLGQVQGNAVLGPQTTATLLLTDDDGGQFLPVLSVDSSLAPQATTDGRTKGVFIITRRDRLGNVPNLGLPLVVAYSARGAALPGVEYRALSGMATIPAGRDTVKIKVKAINGGGGRVSNVKLTLNPGTGYFVTPGAAKAKVKIVFPGTMP